MSNRITFPLSYANIGDVGGLKMSGAATHAPVPPVSTEEWLAILTSDLSRHERKLVEFAGALEREGKHLGWALEQDGRVLRWKGRWGVRVSAEVVSLPKMPKVSFVKMDVVRESLREYGIGYYDVIPLLRKLTTPLTLLELAGAGMINVYDSLALTVHQISVERWVTTRSTPGLFD